MVKALDIHALEETIEKYPWFAAARAEYFERMAAMDREFIRPAARKIGLFVPDRCLLYETVVLEKPRKDTAPAEGTALQAGLQPAETPRRRVPGGDYFTKEDFEELDGEGVSFSDLHFTPKSNLSSSLDTAAGVLAFESRPDMPDTEDVCTETLAGIYFSQGFYRRAIDIYKKLILFYPEKNTYFAALIARCLEKTKQ